MAINQGNTVFDIIGADEMMGHRGLPEVEGGAGTRFHMLGHLSEFLGEASSGHEMLGHLSEFVGAGHEMLGHLGEFVGAGADDLAAAAKDAAAKATAGPGAAPAVRAAATPAGSAAIVKAVQADAQKIVALAKKNGNGGGHDGQTHATKRGSLLELVNKEVVADLTRRGVDLPFLLKKLAERGAPKDWAMLLGLHARMHQKPPLRAITDLLLHANQSGRPLSVVFEDIRKTLAHVYPGIHA